MHEKKVYRLAIVSLLTAVLLVQTFIPWLGYIPLGPISITIVQITIMLGASLFDKQVGTMLGGIWGVLAWLRHLVQPTVVSPVFINPLVSVLPRLLTGFLTGLLASYLKDKLSGRWAYALTGALGSLCNTLLVMGAIYLFARTAYAQALGVSESAIVPIILGVVLTNGLAEMLVSALILPLLAQSLKKVLK
ncbi:MULTISPECIES: ECF transporter S component [Aerococcus]|uniref:ECF transporter S component n=1 Tax=Aerococcus sanguinicola TaxID=119206 RepID=A0A5N1GE90_9LACT|nr:MULTISPECIES: ECF transporter S component [Aerococcus]KAA9299217.1 ECF transporter S component [Aerococcus sanguinicola]MDK6370189.1 ECF transporter S component [Aerococcus sp. UMB9870]MDK6680755.1 ECF transporter S component [Aerococcus sp. UMB8608]MDK6687595.1 ECF transporter S component [Aerococcus sp. UMB8623]MDK6940717.1 ECF transporter S component [Aerococcus sp. UMB8487]